MRVCGGAACALRRAAAAAAAASRRRRAAAASHAARRGLRTTPPCCRNRILFEPHEVEPYREDDDAAAAALSSRGAASAASTSASEGVAACRRVWLPASDARAEHITSVLRAAPGQRLRVGVVNGARASAALSQRRGADADGWEVRWSVADEAPPLPLSNVDVLLALPRPKVARRLWAPLAALGVGALFVTSAARVERAYFGSGSVTEDGAVRAQLLRGLEQAGDTRLPPVFLARRFPPAADAAAGRRAWGDEHEHAAWGSWLVGGVADLPPPPALILLAHPDADGLSVTGALRAAGVTGAEGSSASQASKRILLAIGPEGGWTPHELSVLQGRTAHTPGGGADAGGAGARCALVSLGARTLTTDTAVVALLAAVKEATGAW
jgi:16S rRNA U1498 N3-methylase RsmE